MTVEVRWTAYGRPAADALRLVIRNIKGDEALEPVTVVVPSNHVGVAVRRLLASNVLGPVAGRGVGVAAVTFLTPYRLAELFGAATLAGGGRRPVSTPVIAAAIRSALAEDPGVFGAVSEHPATETALVAAYRELRDLSDPALDDLADQSPRAHDVVRLQRATRARLAPSWYDEQDLTEAASDALRGGDGRRESLGPVIVYLPQRVSLHSGRLLVAASDTATLRVVAGTTGEPRADADVVRSLSRLGWHGPASAEDGTLVSFHPINTAILTASDADEEVREAARRVVEAIREGTRLDRIAVLYASPEPYARLVHEQFAEIGIKVNGTAVVAPAARVAGRTLLGLMALATTGFQRRDVFAWMAGAPIHDEGRAAPVTGWERLSRDAGIVGGRQQWDQRLEDYAVRCDEQAAEDEADPDVEEWKVQRSRGDARRSRGLRRFVLGLIDSVSDATAGPRRWAAHVEWAEGVCDSVLGDERARRAWPDDEQVGATKLAGALQRLRALDGVEGPVGLDVFTRTLQQELDTDLGRVGRFGDGVLAGSVALGVGLDLQLVVVLGLAEGSFPRLVQDDSLLPDNERRAARGELPLQHDRVEQQHRELLAVAAGASRRLLCVPRGDLRRRSDRVPSRWVLDAATAMTGERYGSEELLGGQAPWLEHVASFDAGLRHVTSPMTAQEYRLVELLGDTAARRSLDGLTDSSDAIVARGAQVVAGRRSDRFTRFDGNLNGLAVPSPAEVVMSATRLERWAVCPFAYLLGQVLGVQAVDNPEDELRITPLHRGSLVHAALEDFILSVLARPPADQPSPDQAWTEEDRQQMRLFGAARCAEYEHRGLTGRSIYWIRAREKILGDLDRFLTEDSAHRQSTRTSPLAAEFGFGMGDPQYPAVALRLPDGRHVRFRGKADRIDVTDDGALLVIDYKTGKVGDAKKLTPADPDQGGKKLQLPVYGAAARLRRGTPDAPVRAECWFTSDVGKFERAGYDVTDEVFDRFGLRLLAMVESIEAGVFPPHPTAASTSKWVECDYCDMDALGATELRAQWEGKQADPVLDRYDNAAGLLSGGDAAEVVDV